MATKSALIAELLDEELELSMEEFCEACSGKTQWIIELVEEGAIEPVDRTTTTWRFTGTSLARAQVAMHLRRDLEVNSAGIALALDLLDEVRALREQLTRRALATNERRSE